jgi:hypothetical protein
MVNISQTVNLTVRLIHIGHYMVMILEKTIQLLKL